MRRPVKTYTVISQKFGVPASGTNFGRHLGCDYAVPEGSEVLAPVKGVITQSYLSPVGGNTYEIRETSNGRLHRLMHLKTRPFAVGKVVTEGQVIGLSGGAKGAPYSGTASSGPHVHWDIRKAGTPWSTSFSNYYSPEKLLASPNGPLYLVVKAGEGLAALAKRTGYADYNKESRWAAIAKLNKSGDWRTYNASLKPGQRVRVK